MDSRKVNVIQIVLWAALAVFLAGLLIFGISGGGWSWSSQMSVQKQENVALDGIEKIKMDFSSENITITPVDGSEIKIIESCNRNLREREKFTTSRDGSTLTVAQGQNRISFGFFGMSMNRKVEIQIPRSYSGGMEVALDSGNIVFSGDSAFSGLDCSLTSGNFEAAGLNVSGDASIQTDSGNVKVSSLSARNFDVKVTSGNIRFDTLSGSGDVRGTSGNIRVGSLEISDYANVKTTSGNIELGLPRDLSFEFTGYTTSGNINTDFGIMYESDKKHASAKVGSEPYKKLNAEVTSGNISVTIE
jgi:lia operon protein LiaG